MKIFVQGLSHTGIVFSACLAQIGHKVIGYDGNKNLLKQLKKKISPIYEPGLNQIISKVNFNIK